MNHELIARLLAEAGKRNSNKDETVLRSCITALQGLLDAEEKEPAEAEESLREAEALLADLAEPLVERDFTDDERKVLAKSGAAMSDGGYPIETTADLKNAIQAFGRAKNPDAVKAHIRARAKALGAENLLPDDWKESGAQTELVGDLVNLIEKAVRKDGSASIKLISPGWGSSGFYSPAVLQRDGPKAFPAGTHMYLDHPTPTEEAQRPERSVKDLAATLSTAARWDDHGTDGPGLYAEAKVRSDVAPLIAELAPSIGVSIRALGQAKHGEAEGRKGPVVESIATGKSVDFVTLPGRGGRVLELLEAARTAIRPPSAEQEAEMSEKELEEARRQMTEAQTALTAANTELARLREAALLTEVRALVVARLAKAELPEITRARLTEVLAKAPVLKDGALDRAATEAAVDEAAKAEVEYLAKATGSGQIRGMGASQGAASDAQMTEALTGAFARLGLKDSTAKLAAAGRN